MIWRQLTATFGKLENQTLILHQGLNIIEAPNESGKSTWCVFLRTMLYGLSTRVRGTMADKNRYAPWTSSPMEGQLELEQNGQHITITRRTARANSPMGAFSAVYSGTSTPLEGLSAANCGEELLGIPREVFERSAFIRQSGLAIEQDAELERRIAALITTGEEDTSFSESYERLKRQLNKRRYNRSGLLPQLEGEIASLEQQVRQAENLQQEIRTATAQLPQLEEAERITATQLDQSVARQAAAQQQAAQAEARQIYVQAKSQRDIQRQEVAKQRESAVDLPSRERLIELKSAAGSITVNELSRRQLAEQARQRQQAASEARQAMEDITLFQGRTAGEAREQARQDAETWQQLRRTSARWPLVLLAVLACLALLTAALLVWSSLPLAVLAAAGAAAGLICAVLCRRCKAKADAIAAPYSAKQAEDFTSLAKTYTTLYETWSVRQQEAETAEQRLNDLAANIEQARARLLEELRPFAPGIEELPAAAEAIDQALRQLRQLEEAQAALGRMEARCEALAVALPPEEPIPQPADGQAPDALRRRLEEIRQHLQDLRRQIAACQGQLKALGETADLQAQLSERQAQREDLQAEYDAIAIAMEALNTANITLQNRFSPALGEKAANIFTKLTKGKYNKVLLNRDLAASAQETGKSLPREAYFLSQGAADQLYLAVRLAICDLVLPADKGIPLVLDDALTNFDDQRCAAALDYLMEVSKERQILLFTCQEREGAYLDRAYSGQFHRVTL